MNIIEALQALKDGKPIKYRDGLSRIDMMIDGRIVTKKAGEYRTYVIPISSIFFDSFELYTEPLKLTPEEIKALKLARDCGFNWIYKNIQGNIMLQEYSCGGKSMFAWCAPAFSTILTLENMNEEPMSINELLKDEV